MRNLTFAGKCRYKVTQKSQKQQKGWCTDNDKVTQNARKGDYDTLVVSRSVKRVVKSNHGNHRKAIAWHYIVNENFCDFCVTFKNITFSHSVPFRAECRVPGLFLLPELFHSTFDGKDSDIFGVKNCSGAVIDQI